MSNLPKSFNLEDSILAAWATSDELKVLLENYDELTDAERKSMIEGIQLMLNIKFNKIWKDFEAVIKENN